MSRRALTENDWGFDVNGNTHDNIPLTEQNVGQDVNGNGNHDDGVITINDCDPESIGSAENTNPPLTTCSSLTARPL
jgi:hypothetical protein